MARAGGVRARAMVVPAALRFPGVRDGGRGVGPSARAGRLAPVTRSVSVWGTSFASDGGWRGRKDERGLDR